MASSTAPERAFIDTSGFFALLSRSDRHHGRAIEIVGSRNYFFTTSDAVLGETCTLLQARGQGYLARELFELVQQSKAMNLCYVDAERFWQVKDFFLKHLDQPFSFVDCASFVLMKEHKLRAALTHDEHFRAAGFEPLLA